MKICVGCNSPGGPEATIIDPLEQSEILDYYHLYNDGVFEHIAHTRKCLGGCADLIESIARRGVDAVIVVDLSPNSLLRLRSADVRVFLTEDPSVKISIDLLRQGQLIEIGMDQFSKVGRKQE